MGAVRSTRENRELRHAWAERHVVRNVLDALEEARGEVRTDQLRLLRNLLAGEKTAAEDALKNDGARRVLAIALDGKVDSCTPTATTLAALQALANLATGPERSAYPTDDEHERARTTCEAAVLDALRAEWHAVLDLTRLECARVHSVLCTLVASCARGSGAWEVAAEREVIASLVLRNDKLRAKHAQAPDDADIPKLDRAWDICLATLLEGMTGSLEGFERLAEVLDLIGMDEFSADEVTHMRVKTRILDVINRAQAEWADAPPLAKMDASEVGTSASRPSPPSLSQSILFQAIDLARDAASAVATSPPSEADEDVPARMLNASLMLLRKNLPSDPESKAILSEITRLAVGMLNTLGPIHKPHGVKSDSRPMPFEYNAKYPTKAAYRGYRTDLLAILANIINGTTNGAESVLQLGGLPMLPLMLGQTPIDDDAPMSREWAIVCLKGLCAVPEVREFITQLEIQGVDTDALNAAGLGDYAETIAAQLSKTR